MSTMGFSETLPAERGGWSLYGNRIFAKVPATAIYRPDRNDPAEPIDYEITMTLDVVGGRLVCTQLTATSIDDERPVTSDKIRRVPVGEFIADAAELGGVIVTIERHGSAYAIGEFKPPPDGFAANGMTDAALEQISGLYAFCMAAGLKPTGLLFEKYGIPRPTTSKWIAAARRRGILVDDHRRMPEDFELDVTLGQVARRKLARDAQG